MADDSRVPPLPRRAPDDKRHVPGGKTGWGSGLTQPLTLPESVRQRIRAALDHGEDGAPPPEHNALQEAEASQAEASQEAEAPAGQSASLPRRVPGANNAPEPPAHLARPAMLPSLRPARPAEVVTAAPAATLGAIAAPPVPPPAPMTRVAMWAYLGQTEALTEPLPAIPAARPGAATDRTRERLGAAARPEPTIVLAAEPPAVPAQRAPAEQRPGQPAQLDAQTAGPGQETADRDEVPTHHKNGQASVGRAQLQGTTGLARHPGKSPPWAPLDSPPTAPPEFAPPKSVSPPPVPPRPAPPEAPEAPTPSPEPIWPPERARRGPGFTAGVATTLVLALAGSLAFLLKWPGGTVPVTAPTAAPTTGAGTSAAPSTAAQARAAAAAWVASQVSRAKPISCDPAMCQALRADGVPDADLLVLRPGGGAPLRSRVIVVTPAVTKTVGTKFLTADAPAAIASFGSGSSQVSVRVIFPRGAAAYSAALRQDIADRKANESTLLENPRVTALPSARRQLQGGRVDSRLLLTLAQLASQWPLSIVAFGDRAPGASPGVPLRSADLAVTGDVAGRARQMAAFAHQLQGYFAGARIRVVRLANGQDVVQVAFAAPSPLGVLNG